MDDECLFCGDGRVLHQHHVIPRRFDGADTDDNLITVCPTCHALIEGIYDRDFYEAVGTYEPSTDPYREGVLDTIRLFTHERLNPSHAEHKGWAWWQSAAWEAADQLLPDGYRLCVECVVATTEDPCDNCGCASRDATDE